MTSVTALRAARLFDGTGSRPSDDAVVVVEDGRILSVGGPVPPSAHVVELPGATLLPGLVDTHVHLAFDASDDPVTRLAERDAAETFAVMIAAARRSVRAGVTTVRDLGDPNFLSLGV